MDIARTVKQMTDLWTAGQRQQALDLAAQIVQKFPLQPRANELLAAAHALQCRWSAAAACLERAIQSEPANPSHHFALGVTRGNTGNAAAAVSAFRRALEVSPKFEPAMGPLAESLAETEQWAEADQVLARALQVNPRSANTIGLIAARMGSRARSADGLKFLREKFAAMPGDAGLLAVLCSTLNYVEDVDPAEAHALRERYGKLLPPPVPMLPGQVPNAPDPERPLRIAYISPDFRQHPVAFFTESFLPHHDRANFQTCCYYTSPQEDAATARIRAAAAQWRHMPLVPDPVLFTQLRADRIDIAVELSGTTGLNHLAALARRAAPVQVTYIGSPSSTGVPAIDYRIVDAVTDPPGAEVHASERLVRLDGCFLCFKPPDDAPDVAPPPRLQAGAPITFGSFNNLAKLSPGTIRLWSHLLDRTHDARLLIKGHTLADPAAQSSVREQFAAHGIGPDRLELVGRIPGLSGHLGAYARIDIALDPFPYNGTTTTCDALWMGVPVITLAGSLHAGRVGASLLTAAGCPSWIAGSQERYLEICQSLAADRSALAHTRAGLRARISASRLCDGPAHARALERAYRQMWRAWCGTK